MPTIRDTILTALAGVVLLPCAILAHLGPRPNRRPQAHVSTNSSPGVTLLKHRNWVCQNATKRTDLTDTVRLVMIITKYHGKYVEGAIYMVINALMP
jgi:hypothetical protein